MIFLLFFVFCLVKGGDLIEQPVGWHLTPVHQNSPVLTIEKTDRIVVGCRGAVNHGDETIWLRIEGDSSVLYRLCAGILYKRSLSEDDKGWGHDPMAFEALKAFARTTIKEYASFCEYVCYNYPPEVAQGLQYGCVAAFRDAGCDSMEPIEGGWRFTFPRIGMTDYHLSDIAQSIRDAVRGIHGGVLWLRYCCDKRYAYLPMSCGMMVYNISGDERLWGDSRKDLTYLKYMFDIKNFPKDYEGVRSRVRHTLSAKVYGDEGVKEENLFLLSCLRAPQPNGWTITPVRGTKSSGVIRPLTITLLKKRESDQIIFAQVTRGFFDDGSVWVRCDDDGVKLCAWKATLFFAYDLANKNAWHHLEETLELLEAFVLSKAQKIEHYLRDAPQRRAMRNACMSAVRDALYPPIEAKEGWSLTAYHQGVFDYRSGDGSILLRPISWKYQNCSIWARMCGNSTYLYMRVNNYLCQYNMRSPDHLWQGNPLILDAFKRYLKSDKFLKEEGEIPQEDAALLCNGVRSTVCEVLYKDHTKRIVRCGFSLSKPHPMAFILGYGESLIQGSLQKSHVSIARKEYAPGAMWWCYDGEKNLCFRAGDSLLKYHLDHKCQESCRSEGLKNIVWSNTEEMREVYTLLQSYYLCSDVKLAQAMSCLQKDALTKMFSRAVDILSSMMEGS